MPRSPARDYADRCTAIALDRQGCSRSEIGQTLQRPARWVRRTFARYDSTLGLASLRDHSSRPHRSPRQTPIEIEQAICQLKQAHPRWGSRQIAKQLCWRWKQDPERHVWVTTGRVRCVLARHPEFHTPQPPPVEAPVRQIDYLACNLIWASDIQETRLPDGTVWQTLRWIDLYSRYDLGQLTVPRLTEAMVVESFLAVARQHGLPAIVKTDHDKLWYDAMSGLPSPLTRVLSALGVHHVLVGPKQPWWNGVMERFVRTCREEMCLPERADYLPQAMEATRNFYNDERCHSRCNDQPPATVYQPSQRPLPADFDPQQVPPTLEPTAVKRQVQAGGRVSLLGATYPFHRRYAGQTITVIVDGWCAIARAADGWERAWDLHPSAPQPPHAPPPSLPLPIRRIVNQRGNVTLNSYLYYVGVAWAGQTLLIERSADQWHVTLPDGSTKTWPCKHLFPQPSRTAAPARLPPPEPRDRTRFQPRRVTKGGQISFYKRFYYVGIAYKGQTVGVVASPEGLEIYTPDAAWITTCPWKEAPIPVEPLCTT